MYETHIIKPLRVFKGPVQLKKYCPKPLTNNGNVPEINNNAISNLVALILSNGEKALTKHQVKYNIGFYLNLAKKAMESNDHQTALIIKAALSNFHITRLKIKPNKSMKKTLILLEEKYGDFKSMHSKHVCDMIKNKHDIDYLPSTMVLHMHLSKNRAYESAYRSFGKKNSNLDVVNYQYTNYNPNITNIKKLTMNYVLFMKIIL